MLMELQYANAVKIKFLALMSVSVVLVTLTTQLQPTHLIVYLVVFNSANNVLLTLHATLAYLHS